MSRGPGRIERAILAALARRRQPLLADRWHPLLVRLYDEEPASLVELDRVEFAMRGALVALEPSDGGYEAPLTDLEWDALIDYIVDVLDELHSGPYLGKPLTELVKMMRSAEDPHAVEVSVQRAAKRLEQKSLIQRSYATRDCVSRTGRLWTRTFVCVRITPTAEELAEAAELRAQAKQIRLRNTVECARWIRERGQSVTTRDGHKQIIGYYAALTEWFQHEEPKRDDFKWLKWFENL